ncbi:hypothetical protein ACLB2K_053535 [Fragaria x ananassa]
MTATTSSLAAKAVMQVSNGEEAIYDAFYYLCGRILSKKLVVLPSFSATVSNIWGLKENVMFQQEEGEFFLFQLKDIKVKDPVLSGGPWFFNNSMIVLVGYDGIFALYLVPMHLLEVGSHHRVTDRGV